MKANDIMNKKQKENKAFRMAMLDILNYVFEKDGYVELDGYESMEQMVHFTNRGHRCILFGLSGVNMKEETITLVVSTTLDGVNDIYEVPFGIETFRKETLERIAYEIYDYRWDGGEDENDFDFFAFDKIEEWHHRLFGTVSAY